MNIKEQLAIKLIDYSIITRHTEIITNFKILTLGINPYQGYQYSKINAQPQTLMRKWIELANIFESSDNMICDKICDYNAYKFRGLDSKGKDNKTEYTLHPRFYSWLKQYVKEIKKKYKK